MKQLTDYVPPKPPKQKTMNRNFRFRIAVDQRLGELAEELAMSRHALVSAMIDKLWDETFEEDE